jgi:hypothetical protein
MFRIYETLLDLKFEEVEVPAQLKWHPEVGTVLLFLFIKSVR